MTDKVLKVENLYKQYRLGLVGAGSLKDDLQRFWARMKGHEDPLSKVGELNQLDSAGGDYVWALKNINFEVKRGEVLGIIGKNGAGKSTLLKILSKVTGPTKGNIYINGRIASLLEVGTGFHPELTGKENIFLNGAILGMKKREIRAKMEQIVSFAGVEKYLNTPVKRYSSGMYVRLAFAVAAHLEPEILIVDEVLAVGDVEFQKKAIGKMQDVSKGQGRTVLFVSHNMLAVESLCNRVVLLKNGVIDSIGNASTQIEKYYEVNKKAQKDLIQNSMVRDLIFLNERDEIVEKLKVGQLVKILVSIDASKSFAKFSIGFQIFTDNGFFITALNSASNAEIDIKSGVINITCQISKLPLMPGDYYMNLVLNSDNVNIMNLERFKEFEVLEGPFFDNGWDNSHGRQGIYLEQKWSIN